MTITKTIRLTTNNAPIQISNAHEVTLDFTSNGLAYFDSGLGTHIAVGEVEYEVKGAGSAPDLQLTIAKDHHTPRIKDLDGMQLLETDDIHYDVAFGWRYSGDDAIVWTSVPPRNVDQDRSVNYVVGGTDAPPFSLPVKVKRLST